MKNLKTSLIAALIVPVFAISAFAIPANAYFQDAEATVDACADAEDMEACHAAAAAAAEEMEMMHEDDASDEEDAE